MRFALLLRKILFVSLGSMLLLASAHAQQKASALTGINWVPVTGNGPPTTTSCGVTCNSTFLGLPYIDVLNNNTYVYTGTGAVNGFLQTNASTGGSIPTTPLNALVKINGTNGAASSVSDNGTAVSTTESFNAAGIISVSPDGTNAGVMTVDAGSTSHTVAGTGVFGIMGFNNPSANTYDLQASSTSPTGNQVIAVGATTSGIAQITYIGNSINVNGTPCVLGGAVCTPIANVCGGNTGTCPLQQVNPTSGASTTTTAAITTTQTTIPIANGTGFTFTPGNYVALEMNNLEWIACTGFTATSAPAGNLTGCARAQYATTATAFPSGTAAIQMVSGTSASSTTFPSQYVLANQAYGQGVVNNVTANTFESALPYTLLDGIVISGNQATLAANSGNTLYSQQGKIANGGITTGNCASSSMGVILPSNAFSWAFGATGAVCSLGTQAVPADSFFFIPGATMGVAPVVGNPVAAWLTNTGQFNVEAGYSADVVTLTGATPVINAANAMQTITLTANATPTVTNITAGIKGLTIQVCNASGNSFTWTWPGAFHGVSGAITPTSGTCNVMVWDSFTGTTLFPEGTGTVNVAP
jgi:hypothetical protein